MYMAEIQSALKITKCPNCFYNIYDHLGSTFEERARLILSDSYISETLDACYALMPFKHVILEAAGSVRKNEAMCLFVCLLEQWIRRGCGDISEYEAPQGEGIAFDFLHLFPLIPTMPESVAHLRARGLPEDLIAATMQEYDFSVEKLVEKIGRPCFPKERMNWMRRIVNNKMIRIGRLKFDMPAKLITGVCAYRNQQGELCLLADDVSVHRSGRILGTAGHEEEAGSFFAEITETEEAVRGFPVVDGLIQNEPMELKKCNWTFCLSKDDPVIAIHIPPGEGFHNENIENSYTRAREIFAKHYPEYPYTAFFCKSWLMSRDLQDILQPTSNILAFQSKFIHYPIKSKGISVFYNVFPGIGFPEDLNVLPEDTSLRRNIKKLYMDGGRILDGAGFFF